MEKLNRRNFMKTAGLGFASAWLGCYSQQKKQAPPNILLCMADDWGWPHAGALGDQVVQTPTFDRLAREGVLFDHAFVSSPSCTPSRNAILTGQFHWRLGQGANLHSTLDVNIPVYPLLLEQAGYFIGHWRKCWGPGKLEPGGYVDKYPGGPAFDGFADFLAERPAGKPFCFWLGSSDPHRSYEAGTGKAAGIDPSRIDVPGFFPDTETVRSDIADYYFEVQRFDTDCARALELLEKTGELENTIVVMTGDHGMPFPRCKSNIYDMGVRVPLAIRWGKNVPGKRTIHDLVSFTDFAPTFLEAAGVAVPAEMTGNSLLPLLQTKKSGWVDDTRRSMIFGKERHTPAQLAPSIAGYPCRGIRTDRYLYIYNFEPERWPAGVPSGSSHPMNHFSDCDRSPTKDVIMAMKDDPVNHKYYQWCFGKRPQVELFDMKADPDQLVNLADKPEFQSIRAELHQQLFQRLRETKDPRVIGGGEKFDTYPYRTDYALNKFPVK